MTARQIFPYRKQGFTLIEILVVLVIVGIIAAFTLPNLLTSVNQSKAGVAQNNLLAISAAESKYNEDHGAYCTGACGTTAGINTSLNLNISDTYTYSCGAGAPYTCTATATDGSGVTLTTSGAGVTCTAGGMRRQQLSVLINCLLFDLFGFICYIIK